MSSKKANGASVPKEDWAHELREAERAARKDPRSSCAQARVVAKAARKLRQWKKCKTVSKLGLSFQPNKKLRKELEDCLKAAESELAVASVVGEAQHQTFCKEVMSGTMSVDEIRAEHPVYTNLSILHYAVLQGDVRLMEELVALGAALDFPVFQDDADTSTNPAPAGSTALSLGCAILAKYGEFRNACGIIPPGIEQQLDGISECCTRLVMLGVNFNKRLKLPKLKDNAVPRPYRLEWDGKDSRRTCNAVW